ncbi:MAG: hypothetical protein ACYDEN_14625 [Acidimicrobiales bacterium]
MSLVLSSDLSSAGQRKELLGAAGVAVEPGFWAMTRAGPDLLADGDREQTLLLGLTSKRDTPAKAAARPSVTIEALRLFGS